MLAKNPQFYEGNIITSRVRIARNLWGYPFNITNAGLASEIIQKVRSALDNYDDFKLFRLKSLSSVQLQALKEKHLISQALIDNAEYSGALISLDESVSIMINEEDVIREQCFMKGLRIFEAYKKLDRIDDELSKHFNFAYDKTLGYLTACPTNVGTGLRASVMLFLPALTLSGKIKKVIEVAKAKGVAVRGAFGEGSDSEGYTYQISNEITLGLTEQEILQGVEDFVLAVCEEEREEIENLLKTEELVLMDKAKKSFGYLTNAILLNYEEFLSHIGNVKLGAMLGMIGIDDIEQIDNLITDVRPAIISSDKKKNSTALDNQVLRAKLVRSVLEKIKE